MFLQTKNLIASALLGLSLSGGSSAQDNALKPIAPAKALVAPLAKKPEAATTKVPVKPVDVGEAVDPAKFKYATQPRVPMVLPARALAKLEPKEGIYHGVLINTDTKEIFQKRYAQYVELAGRKPSLIGTFHCRYSRGIEQPAGVFLKRLQLIDSVPNVVPFMRIYLGDWDHRGPFMKAGDILDGKEDAYLMTLVNQSKQFGKPYMLSINHEMNGDWYAFSELYKLQPTDWTSGKFKEVWRYIHKMFQDNGATQVAFAFQPSFHARKLGKFSELESHRAYYPGDAYVDWVGGSYYSNMNLQAIDDLAAAYPNKPIILGEWATKEEKTRWYTPKPYPGDVYFVNQIMNGGPKRFPNLKGMAYFHWTPESELHRNPEQVEVYRKAIAGPNFINGK